VSWVALDAELARWRDAGRAVEFWWRDDDATRRSPALDRLLRISDETVVPLALAVIPLQAEPELFGGLKADVLMHGCDHRNRAATGEKKTEFPAAEPDDEALARLASARARLAALAGPAFLPVLAPPWNRLKHTLAARLPEAGIRGWSGYGARAAAAGVAQVNTHVDIIAWRGDRGFVGVDAALRAAVDHLAAQRKAEVDAGEPTGWLTHHMVHDAAAWDFLGRLFERTQARGVRWLAARALFAGR